MSSALREILMLSCSRLPALVAPALEPELAALLARLATVFPAR